MGGKKGCVALRVLPFFALFRRIRRNLSAKNVGYVYILRIYIPGADHASRVGRRSALLCDVQQYFLFCLVQENLEESLRQKKKQKKTALAVNLERQRC